MIKPIQFNFSEEAYNRLNTLKDQLDVHSKTEVIRLALATLFWVVEELKAGHKILVEREPGKAIEISFPYLPVKSKAEQERSQAAQ